MQAHAAIVKHAPSPLGLCPAASVQPQRGFTYQPSGCDAPPFCVATLGQPSGKNSATLKAVASSRSHAPWGLQPPVSRQMQSQSYGSAFVIALSKRADLRAASTSLRKLGFAVMRLVRRLSARSKWLFNKVGVVWRRVIWVCRLAVGWLKLSTRRHLSLYS